MTTSVLEEEKPEVQESTINPPDYDCQILLEKTTHEIANDKSFPTDARLIRYIVDGVEHMDLTRCGKVSRMFDMYYDRYGKGSVQRIGFGYGSINPKLWGNKPKETKKKK